MNESNSFPPRVKISAFRGDQKRTYPARQNFWTTLPEIVAWSGDWEKCEEVEYLSLEEHTHLLAEAVANAKAEAFEGAAELNQRVELSELVARPKNRIFDYLHNTSVTLFEKASELRKGATPENGEKNG